MSEDTRTNQSVKVDTATLARMTAGASGGMILTRVLNGTVTAPIGGGMLQRVVKIGVPVGVAWATLRYLPSNQYTKGAAIGAAMVAVSQVFNMVMGAMMGTGNNGSNGQEGLRAPTVQSLPQGSRANGRGGHAAGERVASTDSGMGGTQTVSLAQR